MTPAPINLGELERLAREATPGPYRLDGEQCVVTPDDVIVVDYSMSARGDWETDAAYFAAIDPATILALTERLRAAEGARETWASMFAWTSETFGPVTLERVATRANEEMQELLADPSDVEEAADVIICLSRYPGIGEAIDRKMAINRARKWKLNGDGSGYHVKPTTDGEGSSVGTKSEGRSAPPPDTTTSSGE